MQGQQPQQRSILRIRVPAPPPGFPSYVKACWVFTQLRFNLNRERKGGITKRGGNHCLLVSTIQTFTSNFKEQVGRSFFFLPGLSPGLCEA